MKVVPFPGGLRVWPLSTTLSIKEIRALFQGCLLPELGTAYSHSDFMHSKLEPAGSTDLKVFLSPSQDLS